MEKTAIFSSCRKYRYALCRRWGGLFTSAEYVMFIGLNPSTADETNDDPTVRRCIRYAKYWGYSGLCMTNLFAFRATNPEDMKAAEDPIGPENNQTLIDKAKNAEIIIAAWGIHGKYISRDKEVLGIIPQLYYLRLTKKGYPGHPLYLPKNLKPTLWATIGLMTT